MSDTEFDPTLPADAAPTSDADAETQDTTAAPAGQSDSQAAADEAVVSDAAGDAEEPAAGEPVKAAPAAEADADDLEALTAPDADEAPAEQDAPADAADAEAEAEPAPIADDGNVVPPEAIDAPLAEASAIAPALPSASTGPASDAAAEPADAKAEDVAGDEAIKPAPATPAPLDSIRAEAHGASDGDADASAGIVPQPSPEDALAERPLSGIASEENRGAVDAMPAAAQQHMGQWVKGVHEAEPAEAGQLPTTADLPGTSMDATGVGTYPKGGVTQADKAIEAKAEAGDEDAQAILDQSVGAEGEDEGEAADDSLADDGDSADFGDVSVDGDEAADSDSDSDGYFGEVLVQHGPLKDVAGEAIDALKEAAEQAALAQNHFQSVPLAVLDVQHKDLLSDMRVVLGDLLRLSARLFERLER